MKRITYLIFTLLILLPAFSMAGYGKEPARSDELLSFVNKDFEIYAPRRADLELASEAMLHARSVYKKYFGKEAPKIAVVLFDTPAQAAAYDQARFRQRGLGLLKWSATTSRAKFGIAKDLGAVVAESSADGRAQVVDFYFKEPFAGTELQKDDTILSVNNSPAASVEDFMKKMKDAAVGSPITLRLKRGTRETEVKFIKSAKDKPDSAASSLIQNIIQTSGKVPVGKSLIAHEAMHQLMRESLGNSLNIPAWFSEGLASLAETPENRQQRRLRMIELLDKRIPLNTLFTMMHPATGGTVVSSGQPQGAAASGMPITVTSNNPAGIIFYEQSMTLLEFLADAEGERFIGQIGESLARGESMEKVLKAVRKAPADTTQLEVAWVKWLNRQ